MLEHVKQPTDEKSSISNGVFTLRASRIIAVPSTTSDQEKEMQDAYSPHKAVPHLPTLSLKLQVYHFLLTSPPSARVYDREYKFSHILLGRFTKRSAGE